MSAVTATNSNATSFPDVEVAYQDMLDARPAFRTDARWGSGAIDCLGVVLEIYNRGGIGLPDPKGPGSSILAFLDLLDEVSEPTQLFDLVDFHLSQHHILVVHRLGLALSAKRGNNPGGAMYVQKLSKIRGHAGVKYYRLKTSVYPV